MTRVGPSLTHKIIGSSIPQGGRILQFEKSDSIPRLGYIWLLVELLLLGGVAKFFKLKHKDKLKEGDRIIKVEFFVDVKQICKDTTRTLIYICARSDDIRFNNKIGNNKIMAIEIEEERTHPSLSNNANE
jgi:hypothetical protein